MNDAQISVINAELVTLRHLVYAMLALHKKEEMLAIRGHLDRLKERFDRLPSEAVMNLADTEAEAKAVLDAATPYAGALAEVINTLNTLIENQKQC